MKDLEHSHKRHKNLPALEKNWLAWVLVILVMGSLGYWNAPPNFDERTYYIPAIEHFASRFPSLAISDYPFPTPPLCLFLQGITYRLSEGSLFALRIMSTIWVLILSVVILGYQRYVIKNENAYVFWMLMAFPDLLTAAYEIRGHAMTTCFLAAGYMSWVVAKRSISGKYAAIASGCLSIASLTSQYAAPLSLLLTLDAIKNIVKGDRRLPLYFALVGAIPLFILLSFFVIWGGSQPRESVRILGTSSIHTEIVPAQILLGLMCLGAWLFPTQIWSRRRILAFTVLLIPCTMFAYFVSVQGQSSDVLSTLEGPVNKTVRILTLGNHALIVSLFGLLASAGLCTLVPEQNQTNDEYLARVYSLCYLAMLSPIPFLTERKYFPLIFALYLILADRLGNPSVGWRIRIFQRTIPIVGVAYSIYRYYQHFS